MQNNQLAKIKQFIESHQCTELCRIVDDHIEAASIATLSTYDGFQVVCNVPTTIKTWKEAKIFLGY